MRRLLDGELVVLRLHRHWIALVRALALPVGLLALGTLLDGLAGELLAGDVRVVLALAALAALGAWLWVGWMRWTSSSLTLTDQRVILESGVIGRVSKVIALDRVQDVVTRQSLLGRLLGYGSVEIDAIGAAAAELFAPVREPDRLRDEVFVHAGRARRSFRL